MVDGRWTIKTVHEIFLTNALSPESEVSDFGLSAHLEMSDSE
jgi:hypothetical protein